MMRIHHLILYFAALFVSIPVFAQQPLIMIPDKPTQNDSITIFFNAEQGNRALNDWKGDVYLHSGVITQKSATNTSWQHVRGEWGKTISELQLKRESDNLYSFRFHPKSFYGLESDESILRLAFVFRNADGTKAAKHDGDQDFYLNYPGSDSLKSINEIILESLSKEDGPNTDSLYCRGYYQDSLGLILYVGDQKLSVEHFGDNILRFSLDTIGFPAIRNTLSIIGKKSQHEFMTIDAGAFFQFKSLHSPISLLVQKQPFSISVFRDSILVFKENRGLFFKQNSRGLSVSLRPGEAIFGGGSRALPVNRRGHVFPLYNTAVYGYANGVNQLNVSIPFFVSTSNYGLLIDSPIAGAVDCGFSDKSSFNIAQVHGSLSYFLIIDSNYQSILHRYSELTGKQPLPPLWSFGYIQSRYGYKSQSEVLNLVQEFQKEDIPLDAVVLDLFWFGDKQQMGSFEWDSKNWPDPLGMMRTLRKRNIHTILITEPYFTKNSSQYSTAEKQGLFTKTQQGSTYLLKDFWAGSASLLDLTNPKAKSWMGKLYAKHINTGVSGWWSDLGEPEMHPLDMYHMGGSTLKIHNNYSMHWMEVLEEMQKQYAPGNRLFNLIRSGGPGMQRYSAFPWSGDVQRSASGLQAQIPIMLGMSMSGIGYMHSDLGGFTGGAKNEKLYTRWMQFGAFTPIMRAHGEGVPSEPIYYSDSIKAIVQYFITLRMQFLPYNYTMAYKNTRFGTPLARPIFWNGPSSKEFTDINDQYYWGNDIIVAPILHPDSTSRKVILPPGKWFDFWSNYRIPGNSNFTMPAPLNMIPLFVKAGSVIPLTFPIKNTASYGSDSLLLIYFRDSSITEVKSQLFTDDGLSSSSLKDGNYRLLGIQVKEDKTHQMILFSMNTLEGNGYAGEPKSRMIITKWIDVPKPRKISIGKSSIPMAKDEISFYTSPMPIAWHKKSVNPVLPDELHIRCKTSSASMNDIILQYGKGGKK
jgi:oligosaccharide 4-alpha-D-glucosyltransferase